MGIWTEQCIWCKCANIYDTKGCKRDAAKWWPGTGICLLWVQFGNRRIQQSDRSDQRSGQEVWFRWNGHWWSTADERPSGRNRCRSGKCKRCFRSGNLYHHHAGIQIHFRSDHSGSGNWVCYQCQHGNPVLPGNRTSICGKYRSWNYSAWCDSRLCNPDDEPLSERKKKRIWQERSCHECTQSLRIVYYDQWIQLLCSNFWCGMVFKSRYDWCNLYSAVKRCSDQYGMCYFHPACHVHYFW